MTDQERELQETFKALIRHPAWKIVEKWMKDGEDALLKDLEFCALDKIPDIRGELKGLRRIKHKIHEIVTRQ